MTIRKPQSIIKILIIGSLAADALLLTLLSFYHSVFNTPYIMLLLALGASVLAYLSLTAIALRVARVTLSATFIIIFYYLVALTTSLTQGITSPISLLLYCFFILIGGVLMGSTYIVRTTTWSIATLLTLQLLVELGLTLHSNPESTISGVAAYSVLFGIFALVGWLAASQIERALHDSMEAKAEILHQKNLLADALASEEYRRQRLQIEELSNLYEFAELGQQTTLLLHDFANQLMTLSIDIEEKSPAANKRAQQTLTEISHTMQTVRQRLAANEQTAIPVLALLNDIVKEHRAKAQAAHIKLQLRTQTDFQQPVTYGDPLKLRQILTILIDNALQSYAHTTKKQKTVTITLAQTENAVTVTIKDYGIGIPDTVRKDLFKASYTTKTTGHGIGLYIAKQIIERQFNGKIELSPTKKCTEFTVTLRRIH